MLSNNWVEIVDVKIEKLLYYKYTSMDYTDEACYIKK